MTDTTIENTFKLEGIDGAVATVRAFGDACEALPPGWSVETVMRLQDDEAIVERIAMRLAPMSNDAKEWPAEFSELLRKVYRNEARGILSLVDALRDQRLYKVTMPNPTDDAATLRAMFGDPEPELRDLDADTLRELIRNPDLCGPHADEFS